MINFNIRIIEEMNNIKNKTKQNKTKQNKKQKNKKIINK